VILQTYTGFSNHNRSYPVKTVKLALAAALSAGFMSGAIAQAAAPNDAQIAAIVVAANTVDINAGELASKKASSSEVKKFAQRMITDHTAVNKQASDLVAKLNVKPEDNPTSKALKEDGAKTLQQLQGLEGKAFDKAYVDNEVTYHQTVLNAIDKTLLPSASNPELKALITKVRPAIQAHLEHAQHMQSGLK
jgi:putative membrane protein